MNTIVIIESDAQVKALLIKHGKDTAVLPRPNLGPMRYHATWADEECFYCVTRYHGFNLPSDNGYTAIIVPRAGFSNDEVAMILREFIDSGRNEAAPIYSEMIEEEAGVN